MKKLLLILLCFPLLTLAQQTYVPDDNFEAYLEANGMGDGIANNDYVTTFNISGVSSLIMNNQNIADLTGIEDFTALNYLECTFNQLTNFDVSQNNSLTYLDCSGNNLTSLDVSSNTALTYLVCYSNQLTFLDISNNTALTLLSFSNNQIISLDLSNNTFLTDLYCEYNQLTSLDVSNNTVLIRLHCFFNQLECLNIKNGNNNNMIIFLADANPNLTCIEVDDPTWATQNWTNVDAGVTFSTNCNYPLGCFNINPNSVQEIPHSISLYPNPTNENITISIDNFNGNIQTEVYDLIGNRLQTTNETTISLRDYARGIYLLKVSYGDKVEEMKVIKD
jgi:Leucine-rich repeat (LRR) protein